MSIHLFYYPFGGFVRCKIVSFSDTELSLNFITKVFGSSKIEDNQILVVSFRHGSYRNYNPIKGIKITGTASYGSGIIPIKSIFEKVDTNVPMYPKRKITKFNMIDENNLVKEFYCAVNVIMFIKKFKRKTLLNRFKRRVKILIIINKMRIPKLNLNVISKVVCFGVCIINKLKRKMLTLKDPLTCIRSYIITGETNVFNYAAWMPMKNVTQFVRKYNVPLITNRRKVSINKNNYIDVKGYFILGDLFILTDDMLSEYLVYIGTEIGNIPADVWMIIMEYLICVMEPVD